MTHINFRHHYSLDSIVRMLLLAVLLLAAVIWKWDFIYSIYFKDQLTQLGLVINGAILVLFLIGIVRIIFSFLHFMREERALLRFIHNQQKQPERDPLHEIPSNSLIGQRYTVLHELHTNHTPISHNALASTLVATESTRNSLAKFINNTLILTGVFGTIVSLSIALIGASDILESSISATGMGMVIHGMSTALSTTITAIVCYFYFGYFYLRVTDAQTNLVSGIEQITATHLLPKFQVETNTVLYEFTGLIHSLQELVTQMQTSQNTFNKNQEKMDKTFHHYQSEVKGINQNLHTIIDQLRLGFRLRNDD